LDVVLRALPAHGAARGSAATAPLGDHVATFTAPPPAVTSFDDQVRDAVSAGAIRYFSEHAPAVARALFSTNAARWEGIHRFVDPLGLFDPQTQQAILSPIGLLDVYREFFFELDTVLGPPVSHVWVSPGGTVELYEVYTTKKSEERTVETQTEVTVRSEQDTTTQDELSTSVNQDNGRSMNVGVSATGGVNFGVAQASASASFAMSQTHTTAAQTAHKHARQQSDKLSNEIRRSLKTTFKTTVENTDTSSRRYVLNNLTDHLVNYELRRKMRLVGVQLQHVGTQLCWQIYIDDPGAQLGVAELCHVAQPADLSALSPPELPAKPEVRAEDWQCEFYYDPLTGDPNPDSDYDMGAERHYILHQGQINYQQIYAPPVPTGYRLYHVNPLPSMTPEDPNKDPPEFDPKIETDPKTNTFTVTMRHVNFHGQAAISLNVSLVWQPVEDKQAKKDDAAQKAAAEKQKNDAIHMAYVTAVRERVKLASGIAPRAADDLREEERTAIYRDIVARLTQVGGELPMHVTSELIRSIFDVDRMLYFVAADWWKPRHAHQQYKPPSDGTKGKPRQLTDADRVGWGGVGAKGRDNYLITEDAAPAALGASLGWLLQLDGDDRRNAFLNAGYVKAVLPIHPGMEQQALAWLKQAQVEGSDAISPEIMTQVDALAQSVQDLNNDAQKLLETERVFQNGFEPLPGGFVAPQQAYERFSQWIEILPTDQIVAVEYDAASAATGGAGGGM
jgi:hypothetical protein